MSLEVDDEAGIGPVTERSGRRKRHGRDDDHRQRKKPRKAESSVGIIPVVLGSVHDEGDRCGGCGSGGAGEEISPEIGEPSRPAGSDRTLEATATSDGGGSLTLTSEEGAMVVPRFDSLPTDVISATLEFMDRSTLLRVARCGRLLEALVHAPGTRMYLKVNFGTTLPTSDDDPSIIALIRFLERIDALGVTWSPVRYRRIERIGDDARGVTWSPAV